MRLLTLWDLMQRFDAAYFYKLAGAQANLMTVYNRLAPGPLGKEELEALKGAIEALREPLTQFELPYSLMLVDRLTHTLGAPGETTGRDMAYTQAEMMMRIEDELKLKTILQVPCARAAWYEKKDVFGALVTKRFGDDVTQNLEEASNCFALERHTATVFHLMRALEIGLQALATKLGIVLDPKHMNWQDMLDAVNGALKRLPRTTVQEREYHSTCSDAAIHLQHVKDAWRNDTMHPKKSYTEDQALEVLQASKALMSKLAEFV